MWSHAKTYHRKWNFTTKIACLFYFIYLFIKHNITCHRLCNPGLSFKVLDFPESKKFQMKTFLTCAYNKASTEKSHHQNGGQWQLESKNGSHDITVSESTSNSESPPPIPTAHLSHLGPITPSLHSQEPSSFSQDSLPHWSPLHAASRSKPPPFPLLDYSATVTWVQLLHLCIHKNHRPISQYSLLL